MNNLSKILEAKINQVNATLSRPINGANYDGQKMVFRIGNIYLDNGSIAEITNEGGAINVLHYYGSDKRQAIAYLDGIIFAAYQLRMKQIKETEEKNRNAQLEDEAKRMSPTMLIDKIVEVLEDMQSNTSQLQDAQDMLFLLNYKLKQLPDTDREFTPQILELIETIEKRYDYLLKNKEA